MIDTIRGKKVDQALSILQLSKKRAAVFIRYALRAAIANADQAEVDVRQLVITDAIYLLNFLFAPGSPFPPAPGHVEAGLDPTDDDLTCEITGGVCP